MYRLRHFKEIYGRCCIENKDSSFTDYSIYNIYQFSFENFVNNVIRLFTPCETIYLHWLYWYVLLLSILKILNSVREIIAVFGHTKKFFIFRDRQLLHVSHRWREKFRQFFVCLICIMDLYSTLGILTVKPHYMTPWIAVHCFSFVIDILLYVFDICYGIVTPSCHDLVMFVFIYFNLESVWCIRKKFVHAISVDSAKGYSLF